MKEVGYKGKKRDKVMTGESHRFETSLCIHKYAIRRKRLKRKKSERYSGKNMD